LNTNACSVTCGKLALSSQKGRHVMRHQARLSQDEKRQRTSHDKKPARAAVRLFPKIYTAANTATYPPVLVLQMTVPKAFTPVGAVLFGLTLHPARRRPSQPLGSIWQRRAPRVTLHATRDTLQTSTQCMPKPTTPWSPSLVPQLSKSSAWIRRTSENLRRAHLSSCRGRHHRMAAFAAQCKAAICMVKSKRIYSCMIFAQCSWAAGLLKIERNHVRAPRSNAAAVWRAVRQLRD
jgi:hypothetical protein